MATSKTIDRLAPDDKYPAIFYDEPEPEDRVLQFLPLNRVTNILVDMYRDRDDVFAIGEAFIMYDQSDGNRRIAPDFLVAFDVDVKYILENLPNYLIWEIGKQPDFVMEVASKSTYRNDLGRKRDMYQRLGIQEYWRFDHNDGELYGQPLAGERLVDGIYRPIEITEYPDGSMRGYSEVLDMLFHWDGMEFDVLDPRTGLTLHRATRAEARADAAEARIFEEQRRANSEQRRADVEHEARRAAQRRADAAEARIIAEQTARQQAEARERALLDEIERLRRQR